MRTITQIADELKVSRKNVYNKIQSLDIKVIKDGKFSCISDDDFNRISAEITIGKERLNNVLDRDRQVTNNGLSDREYTDLKQQITFLQDQLKEKDRQLQDKDNQLNKIVQANLNLTYKLLPPKEDEIVVDTVTTEDYQTKSFIDKLKFWKK